MPKAEYAEMGGDAVSAFAYPIPLSNIVKSTSPDCASMQAGRLLKISPAASIDFRNKVDAGLAAGDEGDPQERLLLSARHGVGKNQGTLSRPTSASLTSLFLF